MAHQDRKSRKGFLFFCACFWHFQKSPVLCRAKGIERNSLSRLANPQAARGGQTKRNFHKFPQITVIFAFCGFVGSRGRNTAATLAKSPFAALKVLREAHTGEAVTFLERADRGREQTPERRKEERTGSGRKADCGTLRYLQAAV